MAEEEARELVSRPVSDPSALTSDALHRAIENVKELFNIQLAGEIKSQEARIAAIEKAAEVFSESLTTVPTAVDRAVADLRALHQEKFAAVEKQFADAHLLRDEKFRAVQTQISERDIKVSESALATKTAVDAALAAAEKARSSQTESATKAAEKAEMGFTKALEQQTALSQTTTAALRDQIDDLKERIQRIEGQAIGALGQKTDQHGSSSFIVGLVGIGLAILSALIAASAFIRPGR